MILSKYIVVLALSAASPLVVAGQEKVKIMPLGDSITGSPVSRPC